MRHLVISLMAASLLAAAPIMTSADFFQGLVVYLPFDEGDGDVPADLTWRVPW